MINKIPNIVIKATIITFLIISTIFTIDVLNKNPHQVFILDFTYDN